MLDLKFSMCLICNSGLTHLFLESLYNHQPSTMHQLSWKWNRKHITRYIMSLKPHVNWCKPQQFLQNHRCPSWISTIDAKISERDIKWRKNLTKILFLHNFHNLFLIFMYVQTFEKKKKQCSKVNFIKFLKKKLLQHKQFCLVSLVTQLQG